MTGSVGHHVIRRSPRASRPADGRVANAVQGVVDDSRRADRVSTATIAAAIAAVAVLILLMPATPLVGMVLLAAISLGVVAALVRRAEHRRDTGETLERLATKGYLVLADRVAPGLTGTISHLIIGPGGVFVVETRDQPGRVRIRGDELIIGRLSHSVASQLRAQVAAVANTLGPILDGTGATVVPLVCMRHAELPLLHHTVAGIPLLRESQLERHISRSRQVLDDPTVLLLGELADRAMPKAPRVRATQPVVEMVDAPEGLARTGGMAFPTSRS